MAITKRKRNLTTTVDRDTAQQFQELAITLGHGGAAQLLRVMVEEILIQHRRPRQPEQVQKFDQERGFL